MDKKEVFILGSGFSKAIHKDMPLLNDLTEPVEKKIEEEDSIFKNIYRKYIKNRDIGNFEEILTYLYQDFPWKSEKERHLLYSLYIRLAEIVTEVIKEKQEALTKEKLRDKKYIKKFLNYLNDNKANVISLNYDTLLEKLSIAELKPTIYTESKEEGRNFEYLQKIKYLKDNERTSKEKKVNIEPNGERAAVIYFHDYDVDKGDFKNAITNFNDNKCENNLKNVYSTFKSNIKEKYINYLNLYQMPIAYLNNRIAGTFAGEDYETYKLLKLHGSINWYYSAATTEQIYLFSGSKKEEKNLKDLVPVIIPPVLDKTGFFKHSTIKSMWSEAKNLLKEAKKVYIIGYSIPQTDLTVKFMLQSYIPEDCEVIPINKDEKRKDYFRKVFHKQFNKNKLKNKLNEKFIRNDDGVFKDFVKSALKIRFAN